MVQTEENHCRVDENAANEGDVAQLGTGKFYRSAPWWKWQCQSGDGVGMQREEAVDQD